MEDAAPISLLFFRYGGCLIDEVFRGSLKGAREVPNAPYILAMNDEALRRVG